MLSASLMLFSCTSNSGKEMKEPKVKKIEANVNDAHEVPALLDAQQVGFNPINVANWESYPYKPDVQFRIAYTKEGILLHYKVKEASVRAKYGNDNEAVWTDSCVEFFVIPGNNGIYYNIECNCIGTVLVGAGKERSGRVHATQEVMDRIMRWSSLGNQPFEEKIGETEWEVALVIPYTVFFQDTIQSMEGQTARANFYKCGDELQTPHFLSWNPIPVEKPNFHLPEYFGKLIFE